MAPVPTWEAISRAEGASEAAVRAFSRSEPALEATPIRRTMPDGARLDRRVGQAELREEREAELAEGVRRRLGSRSRGAATSEGGETNSWMACSMGLKLSKVEALSRGVSRRDRPRALPRRASSARAA